MEKKTALKSLLSKLNKLDARIKKIVLHPHVWMIPNADEKLAKLYSQVWDMVPEFSAEGYKLDPLSRRVTEISL